MSIYMIEQRYLDLVRRAEEYAESHDGEISDIIADELTNADADIENALINTALIVKELQRDNSTIDAEIERLKELRKNNEIKIEKLSMLFGKYEFEHKSPTVSVKRSTSKYVDIDESALDDTWYTTKIKTTKQPDKLRIRDALKAGIEIKGAEHKTRIKWNVK